MRMMATLKNPMNALKDVGSVVLSMCVSLALRYLHANSSESAMNTTSVTTWKARPVIEISIAGPSSPEDVDDRAPPTDCRTRERMSQGMKNQ